MMLVMMMMVMCQLTLSKSFSTSLSSFIGETEAKIFGSDICRRCPRRRWFLGEEVADPVALTVPEVMPSRRCISILKIETKMTHAYYKVHTAVSGKSAITD